VDFILDIARASIESLGAFGVFVLMVPESMGIVVPSEAVLMLAGVAVRAGEMPFWAAVAAGTLGNLTGSLILYGIGRAGAGWSPSGKTGRALARCDDLFERRGERAVFVARLLPLARSFVSLPAGRARVPLGRFVVLTTSGCLVWSVAFVAAGAAAGAGWQALDRFALPATLALAAMALVLTHLSRRPKSGDG
jgi:membrane protein DedA with SNARE-associated domain